MNILAYQTRLPSMLKKALRKKIKVSIKIKNHFIIGTLQMFDQHLNLIISDAVEIYERNGEKRKELGKIIIRGDSVVYVDFINAKEDKK